MALFHFPFSPKPIPANTQFNSLHQTPPNPILSKTHMNFINNNNNESPTQGNEKDNLIPSMSEIMASSRAQNLHLEVQTLGPFFRVRASSLETKQEIGRAEGVIRVWFGGRILHLDSIRMRRETLEMQKSIFGLGLFVGAVAVRHGFDCGCRKAELLAINDSDLYHSKLVRFYTRMGFKSVHEVNGSSIGDLALMLVWGGKGTRMDADIEELMVKWGRRFKARN
eukprot:TRINITY_DN29276_c0_g1_i1.p1 TRINITY_DN29276_c0_g1~~TRINITY_DN29276_c0_g1_i1.p1  ORF type:complete len:224 (+),score=43.31 TRINITY_DN29276_c0_g1_i1:122-793(+)